MALKKPRLKPQKTLADYLAILIAPILIVALVGSIVFFVLEAGYDGQWESRLRWVMFWFVLASVMIGRISIEQGSAYASGYAMALAGAVGFWTLRFLGPNLLIWFLIALVWWCTHKLVWDCTLIDDSEDASGEGLLDAAGVDAEGTAPRQRRKPRAPLWLRNLFSNRPERKGKAHAPGLWVVWFSLVALPAFGLGQTLLPDGSGGERSYGFLLLCVYILSALGLLMTTSFLGLRRYLRQRYLRMPARVTSHWIAIAATVAVVILVLALLLPRPDASYSLPGLIDKASEKIQEASDFALLKDDGVEDDEGAKSDRAGSQAGDDMEAAGGRSEPSESADEQMPGKGEKKGEGPAEPSKSAEPQSPPPPGEREPMPKSREPQPSESEPSSESSKSTDTKKPPPPGENEPMSESTEPRTSEPQPGETKSDPAGDQETAEESEAPPPEPEAPESAASEPPQWIGTLAKLILYALVAAVLIFLFLRHRAAILAAARQFWNDIRNLFRKQEDTGVPPPAAAGAPTHASPRPFSEFNDPFLSGYADRASAETLVAYSYRALEAWAFDHDLARGEDQTPIEFSRRIGEAAPELAAPALTLSRLYSSMTYADRPPPPESRRHVENLWKHLR